MSKNRKRAEQRRSRKRHEREVQRRRAKAVDRRIDAFLQQWHVRREPVDAEYDDQPDVREDSIRAVALQRRVPWYQAQLDEEHRHWKAWDELHPGFWRTSDLAGQSDDEILADLAGLGGPATRDAALAAFEGAPEYASAWRLALEKWTSRPLSPVESDHLGLIGVELWKRWRPDVPSLERLIVERDAASHASILDSSPAALRALTQIMRGLCERVVVGERETTLAGEPIPLSRWFSEWTLAARFPGAVDPEADDEIPDEAGENFGARVDPEATGEALREAIRCAESLGEQSPEVRARFTFVVALAHRYLGREQDAEQVLRDLAERHPSALAYNLLSLWFYDEPAGAEAAPDEISPRVHSVLLEANERLPADEREALRERLADRDPGLAALIRLD